MKPPNTPIRKSIEAALRPPTEQNKDDLLSEMKVLTANTFVPITFVGVLAGAIFWITTIYSISQANSQAITEIRNNLNADQREINRKFDAILNELNYLKGRLDMEESRRRKPNR